MESPPILILSFAVLGLIFLSAFFSGSETALTSVSRGKMHRLKMSGNRRALAVSKLHENKEQLISSILLGNNVVNIAASAIATSLAISILGPSGVALATVVLTIIVLVFAEVLPKTYAVRHAEQVALAVAPSFIFLTKVLSPFTLAVQAIVNRFIALFSPPASKEMSTVDALRGTVDMYHQQGNFLTEDRDMLSGIFDLGETEVQDIMVHRSDMVTLDLDAPIEETIAFVANSSRTRIPVWKGSAEKIIGILHSKDLFKATYQISGDLSAIDLNSLLQEPWFIPETITLKNQLRDFQQRQRHIALVVDEFGSVNGMVSLEDIVEEILGEIEDEHDAPKAKPIRRLKDGTYAIAGSTPLRELNRELGWKLSDEDATTLAGYVIALAQTLPAVDEIFESDAFLFKILQREANQITLIQVRKLSPDSPAVPAIDPPSPNATS